LTTAKGANILEATPLLISLVFIIWLAILLPASMARTRGRSAVLWVLVSLFLSPLLAILLLLVLGNAQD
jgi:RsiW-degrading membrane proteinase PrsW (M82 family)